MWRIVAQLFFSTFRIGDRFLLRAWKLHFDYDWKHWTPIARPKAFPGRRNYNRAKLGFPIELPSKKPAREYDRLPCYHNQQFYFEEHKMHENWKLPKFLTEYISSGLLVHPFAKRHLQEEREKCYEIFGEPRPLTERVVSRFWNSGKSSIPLHSTIELSVAESFCRGLRRGS